MLIKLYKTSDNNKILINFHTSECWYIEEELTFEENFNMLLNNEGWNLYFIKRTEKLKYLQSFNLETHPEYFI